ncbi:MAG: hypothetical protein DWQ06_14895 [Calditrichaeota bacterium]|nr:MAG: hypothetical protein DWQ06_14895 [Calditrichota bacterium]
MNRLALKTLIFIFFFSCGSKDESQIEKTVEAEIQEEIETKIEIEKSLYEKIDTLKVKRNDTFGKIITRQGLDYSWVPKITTVAKEVFDIRRINVGRKFLFFWENDSTLSKIVYEINKISFLEIQTKNDSVIANLISKNIEVRQKILLGEIDYSLYNTIIDAGGNPLVANKLVDIFGWVIDFFTIQKGDKFKVIIEERYVDGKFVDFGKVLAAEITNWGESYKAFYFEEDDGVYGYFDEEGNSLRRLLLKSPLNFSRISSKYQKGRMHPVLKRRKDHLGTDYAAATGTPIWSTGDGKVIEKGYTRGNGNYVKIRHNNIYTTGYLHMSKFARGMKKGKKVKQKEIIGYVGSTGLATGPHLCYRFYKHGRQIDPFKEKVPSTEPIPQKYKENYLKSVQKWEKELEKILLF